MAENEITQIMVAIGQLQTKVEGALKRIEEQSERDKVLVDIKSMLAVAGQKLEVLTERVSRHGMELDAIKLRPAKRWEAIAGQIISLILATAFGYFINS